MRMTKTDLTYFLRVFAHHADIARQYGDSLLMKEVREAIPDFIRQNTYVGSTVDVISDLATFFRHFMKWNMDTNLVRYNDLRVLLNTKEGRCGEWANLYTAMLNSLGIEARLVLDYTDHVWTEAKVVDEWVAIDSTLPEPILKSYFYEDNWKKKFSYIFAFAPNHIEDVTMTYTRHWRDVLKRRKYDPIPEYLIKMYNHG